MNRIIVALSLLITITLSSKAQNFINYSVGKPVSTSWDGKNPEWVTDGSLVTGAVKKNPKGKEVWVEVDLTAEFKLGAVHLFIDNVGRMPLASFSLQYRINNKWKDIPGSSIDNNFSSQVEVKFPETTSADAVRLLTNSKTGFGIREIQVWGEDTPDMPYDIKMEREEPFKTDKHWVCVNQIGYNLGAPKGFTVPTAASETLKFQIKEKASGKVVYKGKVINGKGNFSDFNPKDSKGKEYVISVKGGALKNAESYPFIIGKHALQENAYPSAVAFFNDARSMIGTHPSAYGGTAWRDGAYYTFEVPGMVMLYLSNPKLFNEMPVTLSWKKEKEFIFSEEFKPTKEPKDKDAKATVKSYYSELPEPNSENIPDILQCIRFGVGWNLIDPVSADPSGDILGEQLHSQTIEQFAYFLYGYPVFKQYFKEEFYKMVLDSTLIWWEKSGLFDVITTIGGGKGRHCPGHSIMPNLLMYEVAKREHMDNADKFLQAAKNQAQWIIENADWNNPAFSKGQRISEQKLITGLTYFLMKHGNEAPKGLKELVNEWADVVVSLSDNMWDFRRLDLKENWTIPGFNEAGNIIAFPACALSVAMVLEEGKTKDRIVELAYAHYDNFCGRNPQNSHCANHPELGFEGVDKGWPYGDKRRNICARLETVRGSLSSLPGTEMYPFNPNGRPRWGEGWTVYNANWNLSLAYMNLFEGFSNPFDIVPNIPEGYKLEWHDEFDGNSLDTKKWAYRVDNKHRSIQLKENVLFKDGNLVLNLRQHKTPIEGKLASGAGIVSTRQFRYGYYEVRAKLGTGKDTDNDGFADDGWHHSFWAMAAVVKGSEVSTTYPDIRRTEIDCYENASDHKHAKESGLNRFTQHIIVWNENGKEWGRLPKPPADIVEPENFNANEWHTYSFKWDEKTVTFYVDGVVSHVAEYPADKFEHDLVNVWLTAISANWCKAGAQDSKAEYDYFRFYTKAE